MLVDRVQQPLVGRGLVALLVCVFAACGHDLPPRTATLTLSLDGLGTLEQPLVLTGTTHIRLRVLNGEFDEPGADYIFDSGCVPYGGDDVKITNVPVGQNLTVVFEGFSDAACNHRRHVGARGGVVIREGDTPDVYYIFVAKVGGFTSFPTLSSEFHQAAERTSCASDGECAGIHSMATCDVFYGHCVVRSYFPLDLGLRRAFHTATAVSDGRIVIAGGLSELKQGYPQDGQYRYGATSSVEIFDPQQVLFERPNLAGNNEIRYAFHQAVALGNNRLVIAGGLADIIFSLDADQVQFPPVFVDSGCSNNMCYVPDFKVFDFTTGSASIGSLPMGAVGQGAVWLGRDAQSQLDRILVTGGRNFNTIFHNANICHVGADGQAQSCTVEATTLRQARAFHASACVERKPDGGCLQFVVVGGTTGTTEPVAFAEAYSDLDREFVGHSIPGAPDSVVGLELVSEGVDLYAFGGVGGSAETPDIAPQLVTRGSDGFGLAPLDLGELPAFESFRLYHQATTFSDGTVLVTGGLDGNSTPTRTCLLFKHGTFQGKIFMHQARFGHAATRVEAGPFQGGVFITGGFIVEAGSLKLARHSELYLPE